MSYKPETETITLSANDGSGGRDLLLIRNSSYENAVKLAEGLGLQSDTKSTPLSWYKWNPIYRLWHDGSEDAEKLRMEMLSLGLPFHLSGFYTNTYNKESRRTWAWCDSGICAPPMWSVNSVLKEIREAAKRYEKQLTTKP